MRFHYGRQKGSIQLRDKHQNASARRILVIDDDLAIRVLLEAVLTRMKLEVTLAEDGEVGLEKLRGGTFDLVLLDLMMPRLDGYEFLKRARQEYGEDYPPTIVFTAAGTRAVEKIPSGSICETILKPFDLEKFTSMVEHCLRGKDQ